MNEMKHKLTKSSCSFDCDDDYDRRAAAIYSSQAQRTWTPWPCAGRPERPITSSNRPCAEKWFAQKYHRPPPDDERTWLLREVSRLNVLDMPGSGSAEYPNYVKVATPTAEECKVGHRALFIANRNDLCMQNSCRLSA